MIGILAALALLCPMPAAADAFTIRLQCVYPEKAYAGQSTKFFTARVKELAGGDADIKFF